MRSIRKRTSERDALLSQQERQGSPSKNERKNVRSSGGLYSRNAALLFLLPLFLSMAVSFLMARFHYYHAEEETVLDLEFPKDIELGKYMGSGSCKVVFHVRIPKLEGTGEDNQYVLKITGDEHLFYTSREIKAFKILNQPPTIPSIPKLVWSAEGVRKYDNTL